MTEEEFHIILGKNVGDISLDEDLFDSGYLDSLSVLELVEKLSPITGMSSLELAGDLAQISTMRKVLEMVEIAETEEQQFDNQI